jgi:hypothetical protein
MIKNGPPEEFRPIRSYSALNRCLEIENKICTEERLRFYRTGVVIAYALSLARVRLGPLVPAVAETHPSVLEI